MIVFTLYQIEFNCNGSFDKAISKQMLQDSKKIILCSIG